MISWTIVPRRIAANLIALSALLCAAPASADLLLVPVQFTSIQSGINAAADGDMVMVAGGSYQERLDFAGKGVTLVAMGGAEVTTIDGNGGGTVLAGAADATVIVGFTVTGGDAFDGGGMRLDGTSPIIVDCRFTGNVATFGGAVSLRNGASPLLLRCTFDDNSANFGGALYCREGAAPEIISCTVNENTALTGTGGGLYALEAEPRLIDVTFSGNSAPNRSGGGIVAFDSDMVLGFCTLENNTASDDGGGILIDGGTFYAAASRFRGNDAAFGGGVAVDAAEAVFAGCEFSENSAEYGGGLFAVNATVDLMQVTIARNTAGAAGGGVRVVNGGALVANAILYHNTPDQLSDFQGVSTIHHSTIEGGWNGAGGDNLTASPRFVNPDAGVFAVLPDSPVIDAGSESIVNPDRADLDRDGDMTEPLPVDITGAPRRIGKGLDHGAYESQDLLTCPADFDYNGKVDFMDLMDILKNWGDCDGCPQDLDGTDYVDGTDLYYLIISWGSCG